MLVSILKEIGFDQYIGDEGCFALQREPRALIGTHVDDMLGIGLSATLDQVEFGIEEILELNKTGNLTRMLGMEFSLTGQCIVLTQMTLIESLVRTHLENTTMHKNGDQLINGERSSIPQDCYGGPINL